MKQKLDNIDQSLSQGDFIRAVRTYGDLFEGKEVFIPSTKVLAGGVLTLPTSVNVEGGSCTDVVVNYQIVGGIVNAMFSIEELSVPADTNGITIRFDISDTSITPSKEIERGELIAGCTLPSFNIDAGSNQIQVWTISAGGDNIISIGIGFTDFVSGGYTTPISGFFSYVI